MQTDHVTGHRRVPAAVNNAAFLLALDAFGLPLAFLVNLVMLMVGGGAREDPSPSSAVLFAWALECGILGSFQAVAAIRLRAGVRTWWTVSLGLYASMVPMSYMDQVLFGTEVRFI
jgi:hypothetical protein